MICMVKLLDMKRKCSFSPEMFYGMVIFVLMLKRVVIDWMCADGKKGGGAHTATPHPNKKGGKTPASSDKGKGQSPKSGGISCKSCSKFVI